jgi:hypothetical protein
VSQGIKMRVCTAMESRPSSPIRSSDAHGTPQVVGLSGTATQALRAMGGSRSIANASIEPDQGFMACFKDQQGIAVQAAIAVWSDAGASYTNRPAGGANAVQ